MYWKRGKQNRPAVGVEYWKSDSSYVAPGTKNSLDEYSSCLDDYAHRGATFNIITDYIVENYEPSDKIVIHELGCNSGYNLDYLKTILDNCGFTSVEFSGNDSWGDAIKLGKIKYPKINLIEKLTFDFLFDIINKKDEKNSIDIIFSHSHCIHLIDEDLDLIYPAIKEGISECFFFEDFDLTQNLKAISIDDDSFESFTFHSENLNITNRTGAAVFGDGNIWSFVKNLNT